MRKSRSSFGFAGNDLEHVVTTTLALKPDLVCLVGDYVHHGSRFIEPCWDVLGGLRAELGVFSVLGNHDHWDGAAATRHAPSPSGRHGAQKLRRMALSRQRPAPDCGAR